MKTNFKTGEQGKDRKYTYDILDRWRTILIRAIAEGITNIVAAAVTVVVTMLVLLGGLWIAYAYLPVNIFYIILAVLIIDVAIGIVLRVVFLRR